MLEAYLSREDMIPFYDCSDFPFNFGFVGFKDGVNAEDVKNSIEELLQTLPEGKTANWVVRKNTNTMENKQIALWIRKYFIF